MRIGIEAWGLSSDLRNTGMGQYTARLLIGMADRPEVEVVAYAGPHEQRPDWLPAEVGWRATGLRLPFKFTAMASRWLPLNHQLRADGIELFHAASVHWRPLFPQVPRTPCPLVVTLHDLIVQTYYDPKTLPIRQQMFERWNLRRALGADALITVSEHARDQIIRHTGQAPTDLRVIHNSIDFPPNTSGEALARLGVQPPYILYAGSFEPRKNLVGAAAAYALLARDVPHDLVAVVERQSGHSQDALTELRKMGLGDRVKLVHSLPEADLRALYTGADVLFFPSLAEGFGYPPLQAAACSLPAVVADLPPLRETLGDWPVYVNPRRPDEMASALRRLLADSNSRARMAETGPALAARFSPGTNTEAHLEVYRRVLQRSEVSLGVA